MDIGKHKGIYLNFVFFAKMILFILKFSVNSVNVSCLYMYS